MSWASIAQRIRAVLQAIGLGFYGAVLLLVAVLAALYVVGLVDLLHDVAFPPPVRIDAQEPTQGAPLSTRRGRSQTASSK